MAAFHFAPVAGFDRPLTSADQLALSSARVSTSSAMMGQAAGIAAALAAKNRCEVRQLDPAEVRRMVLERGARLQV